MRQFRAVPGAMVGAAIVAIVMTAATFYPATRIAVAAPAAYEASFRDLPASVRPGDVLTVQVIVPSKSTCEGTIGYRDGTQQKLASMQDTDGRCRWDTTVPIDARRGTADITVTARKDGNQAVIQASLDVTARTDDLEVAFSTLPGTAKRNQNVPIRVDVADGTTCQGTITYDDGRTQSLDAQTERKGRCRWDITVLSDAVYGPARIRATFTLNGIQTTLASSFDIGRDSSDNNLPIGFQDLATTVRRDDSFAIRLLVPSGATCSGSVSYYGVAPRILDQRTESDGTCVWTGRVPSDARAGNAEVQATAKADSDQSTTTATLAVDRASSDVVASFKDLADSIRRKETLEIRVNVPDQATCDGTFTFLDSDPITLASQTEHKDRCLWEVDVPTNAPRGTATVRVNVHDGSNMTTLVGNVDVLAKDEVSKATWANDLPDSLNPGDSFDVTVNAVTGSTCTGKITYLDGMKWTLGKRSESDSQCKWTVTVPTKTGPGNARVDISVLKGNVETKLTGVFHVEDVSASP